MFNKGVNVWDGFEEGIVENTTLRWKWLTVAYSGGFWAIFQGAVIILLY